jgi:hypothetical protein
VCGTVIEVAVVVESDVGKTWSGVRAWVAPQLWPDSRSLPKAHLHVYLDGASDPGPNAAAQGWRGILGLQA